MKYCLEKLHADFVLAPAGKAPHYVVKDLGNASTSKAAHIPLTESYDVGRRGLFESIVSIGLTVSEEDKDLPYLYWTPKLQKTPFNHCLMARFS